MSHTIAIFKVQYIDKILKSKDINKVFNFEECTYDKSVLEKPLNSIYDELTKNFSPMNGPETVSDEKIDESVEYGFLPNVIYIGYSDSQYIRLMDTLRPLMHKYHCAIYKSDYNAIEYNKFSVSALYRFKSRYRRWIIALRDTLILFLIFEIGYLFFNWLFDLRPNDYGTPPLIDFSTISIKSWSIGAAIISSSRIIVELFTKQYIK